MGKNGDCKKFENLLTETIDEAFSTLGENVRKSIYFHLNQKFMITKQDIPYKIDEFSDALEQIFGIGARMLELLIMTKLQGKIRALYKWEGPNWLVPELTFSQYVSLLKSFYEDNGEIRQVEVIMDAGDQRQEQRA